MTAAAAADPDDVLADVLRVDLADERLYAGERPERIWRTLRAAGTPVRMAGTREHWAVTRYGQIREVLQHGDLLSSQKGMRLGEKATDGRAGEVAGGRSMLVSDDPAHAGMRKALESAFTPRTIRRLADGTAALARRLVTEAAAQGPCDFVTTVAVPLLTEVACDLVGVPESDRQHVAALTNTAFSGSGYSTATDQIAAHVELLEYCAHLIAEKRRAPGDDVATLLARAQLAGRPFPRDVAIMNCHDIILGGNASARFILTSLPMTLIRHRAFWSELRSGTADLDVATEELLRFEAPVNHLMRTLVGDLEIGGVRMRRGELVTLWLRSGNRDADAFDEPETLRASGHRRAHLAFGHGAHHCIAAYLARLEIRSLVRALAEEVGDAELSGVPQRMESNFLRGYRTVPVSLRPRTVAAGGPRRRFT